MRFDFYRYDPVRASGGLIEHLFPFDLSPSDLKGEEHGLAGLDRAWIEALGEGPYAGQDALVAALLDELNERACERGRERTDKRIGEPFAQAPEDVRESLLRGIEAEADPYLTHALRATLAVTLEQRLGDPSRGGNPDALGWTALGLPAEGPRRRLR